MKTIKEKAEEYAYTNWQSDDYHEGAEFDVRGLISKGLAIAVTEDNNPYK